MFHWYLLVGNFVICFWINLVFEIAFDICSVLNLICLFWVNSVYLLCCFSRKFFWVGFDIKLIFGWTLSVKDFVICFSIKLVFEIAFDICFVFNLICLFWEVPLNWWHVICTPARWHVICTPGRWHVICTSARWHVICRAEQTCLASLKFQEQMPSQPGN